MHRLNRVFSARLDEFEQIKKLIDQFGRLAELGHEDRHKLTLIVEELFTNTVTHGHKEDSDSPVFLTLEENQGDLHLIYEDCAPQFDPLALARRADIATTIEERRIGGLGIFLAIGLTENADYSYIEGRNRISLRLLTAR